MRLSRPLLAALLLLGALIGPRPAAAASPIALGVYRPGAPDLAVVRAFDRAVERRVAIVHWYQSWGNDPAFRSGATRALIEDGRTPLITWEPWDWRPGADQAPYRLRAIAAGGQDGYVRAWARAAAAVPGPVMIRFAQEMNADWYPWGAGRPDNAEGDYVAAFRRVVDLFRAEGATNVRFVWAPNVAFPGSAPLAPLYPGDAYVDWVGLDGYNWGTTHPEPGWQSFDAIFRASYDQLEAVAPGRRLMLSEVASNRQGGSKAAWIADALGPRLPLDYPRVEAVVWFDERKEADWRVDSSPSALGAFRRAVGTGAYGSALAP